MSVTDPELWAESDSGEESFDSLSEAALKSLEKRYMSYNTTLIPSSRRLLIGRFNASKDRLAPDFAPFWPFHFQYLGWIQHCQCTTRCNAEGSARHGYAMSNRSLHYGELNPGPVCVCVWISPRRDPEQRSSHSTSPIVIHTLCHPSLGRQLALHNCDAQFCWNYFSCGSSLASPSLLSSRGLCKLFSITSSDFSA